ncbi:hypothetical protein HY604_01275 [Candidatus Peregrinibacteria bacterium]|nr:hypothetical protein [Candidatus Peregrinibacteria bacterium]
MALTDILGKIGKEAEDRIKKFEREFEEKKAKLENEAEEKQKQIKNEMNAKVEENSKKIIEKAEILAERERKGVFLRAKRDMLIELLEDAVKELAKSDDYEAVLEQMLTAVSLEGDNIVVVSAKGREKETKSVIERAGKKYILSQKSADIAGGFIIQTDKVEIDNSFETIIGDQLREDLEIKLNKLLF